MIMFRKKAKKEAKPEDLQEPLLEDTAYTRAMEARRKFEAAQAALEMSKKRFQRFLRRFLNFLGLGVFVLLLVGAVMLEQAESCRFPRYELEEEFRYRIDIESQKDVVLAPLLVEGFCVVVGSSSSILRGGYATLHFDEMCSTTVCLDV